MTRMKKMQDLVEEAKRRTVLWVVFVVGFAYVLSLTSNSIWLNIPIATILLVLLRYLSFELEIHKRVQATDVPLHIYHLLKHQISLEDPLLCSPPLSTRWRRKIDSSVIEGAVDDFTRRIVQEFVMDLWFSSLSPDQDVPEQIRLLMNDIFGEIAQRVKRINLIILLTRDVVDLVGNHLELFRQTKATVGAKLFESLSSEDRDNRLKITLLKKSQLHPALSSPDSEVKVLRQLMSGVVAVLLRPQDAQCPLLRGLVRELLACAVLRPVMKFASPGFINRAIEKGALAGKEKPQNKKSERDTADESLSGRPSKNNSAHLADPGNNAPHSSSEGSYRRGTTRSSEEVSLDSRKTSLTLSSVAHTNFESDASTHGKQGSRGQVLDGMKQRKTDSLAPENFDNLWTLGRNYKKKETERALTKSDQAVLIRGPQTGERSSRLSNDKHDMRSSVKDSSVKRGVLKTNQASQLGDSSNFTEEEASTTSKGERRSFEISKLDKRQESVSSNQLYGQGSLQNEGAGSGVQTYGTAKMQQGGLPNTDLQVARQSPGKSMTDTASANQGLVNERLGTASHNQHTRSPGAGLEGYQKLDNFGVNQDNHLDYWDAPRMQKVTASGKLDQVGGWPNDPADTSGQILSNRSAASKLNCWVIGAHLEKAASKTFAVYSIAVTDSDNKTWFVERRFRNFEQLHRILRDLPQFNLQLPPKRFLASSLNDSFVRDRCILLDKYLKDLLSIPSIAELHEVWDFLSVTSKNYAFSKSPSVMRTLAVIVDDAVDDMFRQLKEVSDGIRQLVGGPPSPRSADGAPLSAAGPGQWPAGPSEVLSRNHLPYFEIERSDNVSDDEYGGLPSVAEDENAHVVEHSHSDSELQLPDSISNALSQRRKSEYDKGGQQFHERIEHVGSDAFSLEESTAGSEILEEEPAVPPEWTPPKLTVPLLNLVDSIFQLQRRGWIRRQVFWMAKQILQLGMGDAVDQWMIMQVQWLRREDVVSSAIRWAQETLWPGGVFITKVNKVEEGSTSDSLASKGMQQAASKGMEQSAFFESQLEAYRCASVVHEILVEGGPAALVGLVGQKQYKRCAKDIYYFLQSTVFLKQLTYSVLETLLTATFPELTRLIFDIRQGSAQILI